MVLERSQFCTHISSREDLVLVKRGKSKSLEISRRLLRWSTEEWQLNWGCRAWVGGSNDLIDGKPKWTNILFCRASLDEKQLSINCEMAAAFVMVEVMKHCVVGGMDLQDFPHDFGLWLSLFVVKGLRRLHISFDCHEQSACLLLLLHTHWCCLYLVQLQGSFYVLPHNHSNVPLHCSSRLPWHPLDPCVLHRDDLTRDWSRLRLQLLWKMVATSTRSWSLLMR